MRNLRGKMIAFKHTVTGKVQWYFIRNTWTIYDLIVNVITSIQHDFDIDMFDLVVAGKDNEHNCRPEDAPCLTDSQDLCEDVYGENLDVAFYIRPLNIYIIPN